MSPEFLKRDLEIPILLLELVCEEKIGQNSCKKKHLKLTCALFLSPEPCPQTLYGLLQIILLLLHVLDDLVTFPEQTLQSPNFSKEAATNLKCKFWVSETSVDELMTDSDTPGTDQHHPHGGQRSLHAETELQLKDRLWTSQNLEGYLLPLMTPVTEYHLSRAVAKDVKNPSGSKRRRG